MDNRYELVPVEEMCSGTRTSDAQVVSGGDEAGRWRHVIFRFVIALQWKCLFSLRVVCDTMSVPPAICGEMQAGLIVSPKLQVLSTSQRIILIGIMMRRAINLRSPAAIPLERLLPTRARPAVLSSCGPDRRSAVRDTELLYVQYITCIIDEQYYWSFSTLRLALQAPGIAEMNDGRPCPNIVTFNCPGAWPPLRMNVSTPGTEGAMCSQYAWERAAMKCIQPPTMGVVV
jgi:hypothetical protein